MHNILIFGAGRVGKLIASLLADCGDYKVHLADMQEPDVSKLKVKLQTVKLNVEDDKAISEYVAKHKIQSVVSALPFFCNLHVAKLCHQLDLNYFDLTEDVAVTDKVEKLAATAKGIFMPQCGLAPGFISIVTNHLMQQFDNPERVKMRVGALPTNVSNPLRYALTWSTDGLINEYLQPCRALRDSKIVNLEPLSNLEEINVDGSRYEAFNTSGGLGSLIETYQGQVEMMDYKSMRYPGHCEKLKLLLHGLRLREDPALFKQILENAIPQTAQDVVLIYVSVVGRKHGQFHEMNYTNKVYPRHVFGRDWSALQMSTASSCCAAIDMVMHNKALQQHFVKQEMLDYNAFLKNRFGKYYAPK